MKKIGICILTVICISIISMLPAAAAEAILFDNWEEMGVVFVGVNDALPEDYYGEGIVNLRCAYSNWDKDQEYMWLVSDWANKRNAPASLYLGDSFDMSEVTEITFDYVTDVKDEGPEGTRVSLTADAEGTQKIASVDIVEFTGGLNNATYETMEIKDASYNGPLYLYIEYSTRLFVGNLKIARGEEPTPEATATLEVTATPEVTESPSATKNNETTQVPVATSSSQITSKPTATVVPSDSEKSSAAFVIIGIIAVIAAAAAILVLVWKKKK